MLPQLSRLKAALQELPRPARYGAVAAALVVFLVWGGNYLYENSQVRAAAAHLAAAEAAATALAARASVLLEPTNQVLTALAQEPRVIAALASASDEGRLALAAELQAQIPGALRLRLIPRGMTQTDPNAAPPLTYSSLDLLQKAAQSTESPGAELHLAGTPNEHVAFVRRAPPDGEAVGFLHLSVASQPLRAALDSLLAGNRDYHSEIRQPVPGAPPIVIAQAGQSVTDDAETMTKLIAGSAWLLGLRTPHTRASVDMNLLLLLPLSLLVLGGLALRRWRARAAPAASTSTVFQGAIEAILSGAHPGLAQLLPGLADAVVTRAAPIAPPPRSLSADDTMMMASPPLEVAPPKVVNSPPLSETATAISPSIFRSYDIRGIVGDTLTPEAVYQIGRAFGAEAGARKQQTVIVARDGRVSSVALRGALVEGLRDAGRDVLDIGLTPTPVLYFATHYLDTRTGVMITGSHNPAQYNGLKMVLDGETLSGAAIQAIRRRIDDQDLTTGTGNLQEIEIVPDYIRRISEDIPVSLGDALKVVVDCGNSVPGIVAPHILRAIGHDVIELYCEIDGEFPNHHPDPSQPENLEDLIAIVRHEQADLGLAFDGDGDRLGVVDREGNILWPDRQLMLFAQDVLSRNPGAKILYDVKCSRLLAEVIRGAGGEPIMCQSGHSLIKQKMQETGALLAGEMSGHIFFKERWYGFDDALYSAARLLEILVNANEPPEQVFARLPQAVATPELRLDMPEERHAGFMQEVRAALDFPDGELTEIDGIRVDFTHSWGLVRPSNTTPCLVLRFEGDTHAALAEVKERFRTLLVSVDPNLELPF